MDQMDEAIKVQRLNRNQIGQLEKAANSCCKKIL